MIEVLSVNWGELMWIDCLWMWEIWMLGIFWWRDSKFYPLGYW